MIQETEGMTLEERKLAADIRLREMELQLKREELQSRIAAQGDRSPILVPVWVAVLGLVGGLALTILQGFFNGQLEKDKAKSALILKAIETGNVKDSATNLRFLIETGLLEDPSGKITALLNKPEDVPKLPAPSGSHSSESILPNAVEVTGTDKVELLCQDPTNPAAAVQLGIDRDQLSASQGRARLPGLTSGSHSLWWSVDTPSTCELVVNGDVRYRYQVPPGNGALLLEVR